MDKDDTLLINWNEWRDYLLMHPSSDITEIVHFWRHAMVSIQCCIYSVRFYVLFMDCCSFFPPFFKNRLMFTLLGEK